MTDLIWKKIVITDVMNTNDQLSLLFATNVCNNNLEYVIANCHLINKIMIKRIFLLACCYTSNLDVIRYLVDIIVSRFSIDVTMCRFERTCHCFIFGENYFTLACKYNTSLVVIRYLAGLNINYTSDHVRGGFLNACESNSNLDVIKYFIEELKIDANCTTAHMWSGLTHACVSNSNLAIIRYLVEEIKLDIHHECDHEYHYFVLACTHNKNLNIIMYLADKFKLDSNEFVNKIQRINRNYVTEGVYGAFVHNPNLNVVKYLVEHPNISPRNSICGNFDRFRKIIMNQQNTNNYIRFCDLLNKGIEQFLDKEICSLLYDINHLMIQKNVVERFKIKDPFELKFRPFVKKFSKLTINVTKYYASLHLD